MNQMNDAQPMRPNAPNPLPAQFQQPRIFLSRTKKRNWQRRQKRTRKRESWKLAASVVVVSQMAESVGDLDKQIEEASEEQAQCTF
jgi:hypothetical protein